MKLEESICPKCGGKLKKTENDYECESCGSHFTPSFADDYQATLIKTVENVVGKVLAGQKIEKISRLKRELWEEIRDDKPFIDSPEILRICSLIRSEVDNDFFANFFLIANSDSVDFKKLNDFLEKINVEENRPFIDKILEFLLRSPTLLVNDEVVLNIAHLIDETYPRSDKRWKDFRNKLENQKKLKERDVFVANKPRDVFVAYSSKDQENNKNKVSEIVKYLESCGLSCFVAYRNLQRGSGATRDYKNELKSAIKNCTVFLLISSKNSRNSPDVRDEMRFVTELSNGGTKKPRVEYLLEDYDYKEEKPDNINKFKDFFGGLVWISGQDKRELKERIIALKEEAEKSKNPSPPYVAKPSGTASEKPKTTEKPRKSLAPVMIIAAVLLVMTAAVGWLSSGFVNWDWLIPSKNEDIFVENDVKYRKTADGSYIATGLTGNLVNLTVPSALSDGPVIAIGEKAFAGSPLLESVIIEEGIDSVGAEAFSGCSKLKKVDILAEIDVVRDKLFSGCSNLVSVKLPSSVNSIGNSAFLDCVSLSEISLPDNLKSLGSFAFGNCSGLTSVTLPESLVSIGENVFKGCDKLTSAVVPVRALSFLPTQSIEKLTINGGESVPKNSFKNFQSLKTLVLGESVTSVNDWAFYNCSSLSEINVSKDNPAYRTIDGNLYSKDSTCLHIYAPGKTESTFTVPEKVTTIGNYAFSGCPNLVSVKLPSSVNSIGNSAFLDCVSLSEISLPDNLKSLGSFAFGNCSGLTSVTLPESLVSIGENVFKGCDKLTSAVVPVRALSFLPTQSIEKLTINGGESVPKNSFKNFQSLKTLVLGESVTSVNDWAFYNCSSLSEIVVRNTNAVCSYRAFLSCDKLTYVEAPMRIISNLSHSSISRLKITGGVVNGLSEMKNLTEVIVEEGVTEFSYGAFKDCTALEKISLPDSTEIVGDDAFSGCTALKFNLYENAKYLGNESNPYLVLVRTASQAIKNLTVHPDARVICNDAFHECPKLVSVDLGNVRYVGTNAFSNCILLESANLGTALTYLDEYAFYNCEALKTVSVPDTITKIDTHALLGCHSLSYNTDGKGFYLGNANNPYVVLMKIDDKLTEYTIQSSARIILKVKSFLFTPNLLERVIIPDSVVYIGYGAFQWCTALKEAVIPDSVSETDNCVFEGCESLTSVIFGNGLKSVSYGMFSGCSALADIYIPEGISYIDPYACDGCVSLSEINVSKDNPAYRTIDGNLYSKDSTCLHIYAPGKTESTFTVPEKVTTIGDFAFNGCKKLTEIVVGENVSAIGYKSFGNCSSLADIYIPEGISYIYPNAFDGCVSLSEINVSKDNPAYRTIDGNLYSKDSTCLHIYAPGKTESTFTVPEKVTTIGNYAFSGCKKLTEIVVGENVSAIGYKSFGNCSSLSRVVLPSTLTKLSAYAFDGCENLTEIVFLGTVEQWNSIVKFIPVFNNVPVTTVVCTDGTAEIGG